MADADKSAEDFKAQGNAAFAQGQYAEAEELYTQAISADPTNHVRPQDISVNKL